MSTKTRRTGKGKSKAKGTARYSSAGPIAFFVSLFIVALGAIQLVSTFHTYALNLAELNGLKKQEASLIAQKQELENDIARWDDKAYVTAQARDRLGFVFPGEQAIRVQNPEAVTGESAANANDASQSKSQKTSLPWYKEMAYSFKQADQADDKKAAANGGTTKSNGQQDESSANTQNNDQSQSGAQ